MSLKNAVEIWSVCSQIVALTSLDPTAAEIHTPTASAAAQQPHLKQDAPTTANETSGFTFPVPSITPALPTVAPGTASNSVSVVTQLTAVFWLENYGLSMGFYEAAVVFWFVLCRMGKDWWNDVASSSGVGESVPDLRRRYFECVQDLARGLRLFETIMGEGDLHSDARAPTPNMMASDSTYSNIRTPLVDCIGAMLAEISQQEDFSAKEAATSNVDCESVNSLVFEMQVLSMEATVPEDVMQQNRSPWVLLGLLGIDVGGKFRWGAAYEAVWKNGYLYQQIIILLHLYDRSNQPDDNHGDPLGNSLREGYAAKFYWAFGPSRLPAPNTDEETYCLDFLFSQFIEPFKQEDRNLIDTEESQTALEFNAENPTRSNFEAALHERDKMCLFCWGRMALEATVLIPQAPSTSTLLNRGYQALLNRTGLESEYQVQNGVPLCVSCQKEVDGLGRYFDVVDGHLVAKIVNMTNDPNDSDYLDDISVITSYRVIATTK
ncbi:hypothetical protein HDU81_004528 [Chytriomyces hyalinus]|nr:hypothetical protein HDU81_004528 [Chytriomyces hyalinus]